MTIIISKEIERKKIDFDNIITSKEIERKEILVSKFKEDTINHIEIQEFIAILEKEKCMAEEEEEEGELKKQVE